MKRLAGLFLAGSLAFGNMYNHINEKQEINIPFNFKTTAQNKIQNVSISHNDKQVILTTKYKVKIFNTNDGELVKVINLNNIIKSYFSNDDKKIFILTKNKFYTYDATTYQEVGHINSFNRQGFKDFFTKEEFLGLVGRKYNSNISIFNFKTGNKISSFRGNRYIYHGAFSPTLKKIALTNDNSTTFIYNLNGDLLNTLSKGYYDIKWVDKDNIVVLERRSAYVLNVKTGKIISTIKTGDEIDRIEVLNKNNILIFNDNKMNIFNISKGSFSNKEFIVTGRNSNDDIYSVALSDDKRFLAVAYRSKNMKFYKTSEMFKDFINATNNNNSNNNVLQLTSQTTQQIEAPKVIIKKEIVEKVIVKTVKVKDTENKKPTLSIYTSQTEGEVPLTVNFKFVANDEDGKIASYYVNFAGKEVKNSGNPTKSFNYTFKNAGKYKIMMAVKDDKGAIATKEITINVKPKHEESFEDYKRNLIGR